MSRIRANGVAGALTAPLAVGDTTMSSGGLADLPAVTAPDVAAVTLFVTDGDGRVTKQEIVSVTAHAAAATTATITRAQEGTTAKTWAVGDHWTHDATVADFVKTTTLYWFVSTDIISTTIATTISAVPGTTLTLPPSTLARVAVCNATVQANGRQRYNLLLDNVGYHDSAGVTNTVSSTKYTCSLAGVVIPIPGDGAAHTLAIGMLADSSSGAINFSTRTLSALVVVGSASPLTL